MSAINSATVLNRLAQTISLTDTTYSVGNVYCYLYPCGTDNGYVIHMDIYTCDDLGKPETIISSQTLAGTSITQDGWYSFTFNISGVTPSNKYMSFVLWQAGGDEDNYSLWGYSYSDILGTKSWISNDAVTWVQHEGVVRGLKVVGSFSAFDLTNHRILTPPTTVTTTVGEFDGGTYNGTKLVAGSYQYGTDRVEIDYSPFLASFVVDSSGSMGWNDRFGSRKEFIQETIQKIKDNYPADVLFDIVKFGALVANTSSVTSGFGSPVTINLDLNVPTRTTYRFVVSGATANYGDVYSANGNSFTVIQDISSEDVLFCTGNFSPAPLGSDILDRVSGSGDITISYDSFTTSSIFDPIVAYGFKNLESGHTYNVGAIDIGGGFTSEVTLLNWQTLTTDSVTLSISTNGPNSSNSLDFTSPDSMVLRKALSLQSLDTTQLTSDVLGGSNVASVLTSSITSIGQYVDIFDKDIGSMGLLVANTTSTTLTFSNTLLYDIYKWDTNSGLVQVSNLSSPVYVASTTAKLLVRDPIKTRNITFFLQTINGLNIEWDFQPFEEWVIYNLFWNDETAVLPVTVLDSDGNPFPDGTRIDMYVGGYPDDSQINQVPATLLSKNASAGSFRLDLDSVDGYSVGQEIDIVTNNGGLQTVEIASVGSYYIILSSPLVYDYNVSDGSRIVPHSATVDQTSALSQTSSDVNMLSASLGLVDATPIYTGKSLDPSLLKPYDPPPVSPSAEYSDLLMDEDRIRYYASDVPTIDGKIFVQILPISEDNCKTIKEKEAESARTIRASAPPVYTDQMTQNEDDPYQAEESLSNAAASVTTTTTTATIIPKDYDIDSPIYLSGGTAQSFMTTYAGSYTTTQEFDGINVPGVGMVTSIMVKTYPIYPAIVIEDETNGMILAKQYLAPFNVSFTPSVWIFSNCVVDRMPITQEYWEEPDESCDPKSGRYYTATEYLNGVYANNNQSITINYTVTYQGDLANNITLIAKIYSNTNQQSETLARSASVSEPPTNQYFNSVLPKATRTIRESTEEYQPLTDIDQWRSAVNLNPASQIISSTNEDQDSVSKNYSDTITGQYQRFLTGTLGMEDVSGVAFDPEVPSVLDGTSFYTNPWEWTKATQYGEYQEQTVNVVNGKATIVIPPSDIVATLFVEASVKFGQNNSFETIRADHIAVANPINIGAINPSNIEAQGGSSKYEIGTNIRWYNEVIPSAISNISVSFSPEYTTCLPSVAKTDSSGYATGVRIGPHAPVAMNCPDPDSDAAIAGCRCYGEYETITITVSKLAYSRTVTRHIEWFSPLTDKESPTDLDSQFYFICEASGSSWADSVNNSGATTVTSDMGWIENDLWVNAQYPGDGTLRIGCGKDQTEETPTPLSPTKVWPFSCGLKFVLDDPRWLSTDCTDIFTLSSTFSAKVYGINQNVGNIKPVSYDKEYDENRPWKWKINVGTYYHYTDTDGTRRGRIGTGCVSPGPFQTATPSGGTKLIIPYPMAEITEPLGIVVTNEAYNGQFIRNGIESTSVVAEVTWKEQPITNWFTTSDSTIIEYPFPQVAFQAGTCVSENFISETLTTPKMAKDHRGTVDDCFEIGGNPDISLNSYSVTASLSRTDINQQGINVHTHSCTVDKNGNGITTQTIVLDGAYEDHTHVITNYVGLSSGTVSPHSHTLRCVAVTNLNPTTNSTVDIAVNAYAYYDPTHCDPYSSSSLKVNDPYKDGEMGNRMMFGTTRFYSAYKDKQLVFSLTAPEISWTAIDVADPYAGWTSANVTSELKTIGVEVSAYWSEYSIEDSPGYWTIVPSQPVADGTRIALDIKAYKPSVQGEQNSIAIIRPDSIRDYMYVKVTASAKIDGYEASESCVITVRSSIQWLPGKTALFFEPTNDDVYIANAISKIITVGASQIHDGVNYAAKRIIDFQTSQTAWKDAKKVIFLLTDGDENTSQYTITQAINGVNFIDGKCEVPVIPIRLGYSCASDEVLMDKYALDTCGESRYMINPSSAEISDIIDDVFGSDVMSMNNGTYTNTIDLGSGNLPSTIYLRNFVIPIGARIIYRTRTSLDEIAWSDWSEWYDSSIDTSYTETISNVNRYFQYQVKLYGNENFETPYITSGVIMEYYKTQVFSVFFQPINLDINTDQYVASIHITHTGSIPDTSTINYGFAQFNTTDINDYSSTTRPSITPDRHTILLTRYNEVFLTQDHQTYVAINGGWPDSATVEIYRVNDTNVLGELVDPSTYATNNKDGKVTFYNVRSSDDTFVLCVNFDTVFRIIMNAVNYGSNSAVIDHIGIMYNVTKRIPKDSLGNIIHAPINMRF